MYFFSLKKVEKTLFLDFMQILIMLITFWMKVIGGWTQKVFCRARRALQKSLWARPRQTLASGSKSPTSVLPSTSASVFRAEGRSGDPKFLRQKVSSTPNCIGSIIKIFAGGPPPPTASKICWRWGGSAIRRYMKYSKLLVYIMA